MILPIIVHAVFICLPHLYFVEFQFVHFGYVRTTIEICEEPYARLNQQPIL